VPPKRAKKHASPRKKPAAKKKPAS